jgi:competence ComEA-like helix-hairpin-helix protein
LARCLRYGRSIFRVFSYFSCGMKKQLKAYLSFTRTEWMGLVFLCSLLFIFIIIRATMPFWVRPIVNKDREAKLVAAWEIFKRSQPPATNDTAGQGKNDYQDAYDDNRSPLPNIINLNTADSATLVRLKGIGPVTAAKIIAYRNKNGPFSSVSQLLEVHHFPSATFDILKKHLCVDTAGTAIKK